MTIENDVLQYLHTHEKMPKLTKAKAQEALVALAERYGVNAEEVAPLYKFFMPAPPKKAKAPIDWLYKAVAKEERRPYLKYVYKRNGIAYGTDGARMHYITETQYPEGYLNVKGGPLELDWAFPDTERLLPTPEQESQQTVYCLSDLELVPLAGNTFAYRIEGIPFNKVYIEQALNGDKEFSGVVDESKLYMKVGMGNAIVMGLRE